MRNHHTIEEFLTSWIQKAFLDFSASCREAMSQIRVVRTTEKGFGDYQCNASMALARILKMNPRDIARAVTEGMTQIEPVEKVEVAGPGFINIYLRTSYLAKLLEKGLSIPSIGKGKKIIIDYSGPNIAKPMHIGHIRSTIIGQALDRLHRLLGYEVIAENHLGDWGTQFGLILQGYKHFVNEKELSEQPVNELERIYVESQQRARDNEEWLEASRQELVKLQRGDEENLALWKNFVALSRDTFNRVYERLDVQFDLTRGESYYNAMLPKVLEEINEAGLLEESEGAQVVNLEQEDLGVCIVQKKDGGFNYSTTDLATVKSRIQEFQPASILYITDERQQLHFKRIFKVCEKMGWETDMQHIWFGLMRLPEGTFSTRDGNVIKLEEWLNEAEQRALKMVQESRPDMDEAQQRKISKAVGIGAVKYTDLSQNLQSMITFSWEKALSLDGNSAPYLQYAYARIQSVLNKYKEQYPKKILDDFPILPEENIEREIVLRTLQFPEILIKACDLYRPNLLTDYFFDLTQIYNRFYQNFPFLKAPPGIRESRLRICTHVADIIQTGLKALGIETPKKI